MEKLKSHWNSLEQTDVSVSLELVLAANFS